MGFLKSATSTKDKEHAIHAANKLGFNYKWNWYLIYCAFWGGFTHFTLGYDSGVAGGLFTQKPFLAKFFPHFTGHKDTPYCQYASNSIAIYTFLLFPPALLSSLVCSFVIRSFGRPSAIILGSFFNIVGTVIQITAQTTAVLYVGRCFNGVGEGFNQFVFNIYLAEIAPAQIRGTIVGFSITWSAFGVTMGQLCNYLVGQRHNGWQISLSVLIVPSFFLIVNAFFMLDTPTSLLMRGKKDQARHALQKYRGVQDVEAELADLDLATTNRTSTKDAFKLLRQKRYWPSIIITTVQYTLLNWTGNSAMVLYGPQVFSLLNKGAQTALLNATIVGGAKIAGVWIGISLLDRVLTRRTVLAWGGVLQTVFLVSTAIIFALGVPNVKNAHVSTGVAQAILANIILYEISFMGGQHIGSIGMAAEVVPIEVRPSVFPISFVVYGIQTMILSYSFTFQLCAMTWGTFLFMASFAVILFFWAIFFIPETHQVPLERVKRVLAEHRVWRHFFPPSDAEEGKHVDDDEDKDSEAKVSPAPSAELPKLTAGEDAQK